MQQANVTKYAYKRTNTHTHKCTQNSVESLHACSGSVIETHGMPCKETIE